jgi:hypothetical protein
VHLLEVRDASIRPLALKNSSNFFEDGGNIVFWRTNLAESFVLHGRLTKIGIAQW